MGLVGMVVDAAIGWLVQSILMSFFTRQMEVWTREVGLAEDVEKLELEMRNMQMVLAAAEGRRIDNRPLSWSLDDLKELLYDAEDVMDELDYYRFQQQIEEGKGCNAAACTNPEGSCVSSSTPSYFKLVSSTMNRIISWATHGRKRKREEEEPTHSTMLPLEIKHDISERINGIVNRLRTIGNPVQGVLQLETSRPIATSNQSQSVAWNTRLTTSVPFECKVYGRDAERDKIIELLINGKSSDLHVLPVVGIGGVGKTTLARFVYGDQRIKDHFDLHMWVCVSTNFDKVRLTIEILEHVCKDRQVYKEISSLNVLQEILLKYIRNKRFLLVLDDMWEYKDRSGWDKLLAPLKSNQATGCMILATTRSTYVAEMIGTMGKNKLIKVNGLDEKEFWLFFKACAFGDENYKGHPSLHSIGQQIAKALKGCPLAARSVGALLYRNVSYEHWKTVQNKWKSLQGEDDDILPILKLSYDYLPFHLQRCFSYCSLFPEDHSFNGEVLVRAWISQNFVQCEDTSNRLEETGRQYLNRLVDFGFFQRVDSQYVMHDLMHELAEQVSSNECATINGLQSKTIRPCIRHLSIITTGHDKDEHASFPREKFRKILQMIRPLQKLRTLMFFGRSSVHLLRSLLTLCEEAKTLRFLRVHATGADVGSILSILKPCHLRYLEFVCVSTTNILEFEVYNNTAFPQALTRFYHLQVLDVGISGNLAIPTGMNNLVNLRHLIAHEKVHCAIACVSNMTSLQELKFKVQNSSNFEIRQLQLMNQLVTLGISQLENVKTKEEASDASLIDKEHLEKLSLSWDDSSMSLEPTTKRTRDVLEGLEPHQNLKHLRITRYCGATSPTWLASNVSVTSLQTLHLESCREWRILPSIEMLPLLRKLKLVRMCNLMEVSIPSLEELVLVNMPKLEKCIGTYGLELTSHLRVLMVKDCPQLNEFTLFQSDSSFQAEQKSWFPSLKELTIGHCPHIIKWEILPLREMRALKELQLMDVHVVRVLSVPSLEKLVLIKMPGLESCSGLTASPPLQFSLSQVEENEWLSSLRELIIHDCPSLMVSHPLPPSAHIRVFSIKVDSTFPSIKINHRRLTIESNELSVLDDKILAFHNLGGIIFLSIQNCPNLISISSEGLSQLTALVYLRMDCCPNLLSSHVMSEAAPENSTSANSIVLPSLKYMYIWSCGITGGWLTQMLPHLQSLDRLTIGYCPRIKWLSNSQRTETEGSSSLASAATAEASSAQDELLLKVPSNILCSLKRLVISGCPDVEFCGGNGGFGGFTPLEELRIYGCPKLIASLVSDTKDGSNMDVGLLPPSLKKLGISHLPENMQSYLTKGLAHLKYLFLGPCPYLKRVQLQSCTGLEDLTIWCEQLGVLEGLQFLSSLRSLEIEMNSELSATWDLKLHEQEQSLNQIGLLPPSLEVLRIRNLTDEVQSRLLSCLPPITELAIEESPKLTSLQLGYCTALKELEIGNCELLASIEGFECIRKLRSLKVYDSPSLPLCLELVSQHQGACELWSQLEILEIGDASVLTMFLCKHLTSLPRLRFYCWGSKHGQSMVSLTEEQERALQLLTSLQELEFWGCPNLLSLPANLQSLNSLEKLRIWCCPSISRLPEMGLPPSLKQLEVHGCSEELLYKCRLALPEMGLPPSLKQLEVHGRSEELLYKLEGAPRQTARIRVGTM